MLIFNEKNWFTLIEVIVSVWILTISVFWIYKLIAWNNNLVYNKNIELKSVWLLKTIKQCIDHNNETTPWLYYIDLWVDNKSCGQINTETKNYIDNIEYIIETELLSDSMDNYYNWRISIKNWITKPLEENYLQKK